MSAYLPTSSVHALEMLALLVATLLAALAITRSFAGRTGRVLAWTLAAFAAICADRLTDGEPAGARMLVTCAAVLFAMKAVVSIEQARTSPQLGAARWLWFAATWPGMRPDAFAHAPAGSPSAGDLVRRGLRHMALGAALLVLARVAWHASGSRALATALVLPGSSFVVHFGAFNVLAGAWRRLGADTGRLFVSPLRARSLREFWGRRWNLAFSEMTRLAVYQPARAHLGRGAATAAAFLFSGVLHELAISWPVRAGFGLPLLYFVLQGGAMLAEHELARRGTPIERMGWIAHAWTLAWLVLPMPILFHPPFLRGVVWPILGIPG